MRISSIGRFEQDHSGGSDEYAHDSHIGWLSPFVSDDLSFP